MTDEYTNFRPLSIAEPTQVSISTTLPSTTIVANFSPKSVSSTNIPGKSTTDIGTTFTRKSSSSTVSSSSTTSSDAATTTAIEGSNQLKLTNSNSTALGLGIGIPVGILVILLITTGSWYYFKMKKKTNDTILPTNNQYYDFSSFDGKNSYINQFNQSDSRIPKQQSLFHTDNKESDYNYKYSYENDKQLPKIDNYQGQGIATPIRFMSVPQKIKRESVALLNRLSKVGKIEEEGENNSISPMFLKRFNLNKPFTPRTPKIQKAEKVDIIGEGRGALIYSRNERNSSTTSNLTSSKYSSNFPTPENVKPTVFKTPSTEKKLPNIPKLPSLIKMENPIEDTKFKVIRSFKKKLTDEINLSIGESIEILKLHKDDWCLVKNEFGKIGMVPRNCLEIFNKD